METKQLQVKKTINCNGKILDFQTPKIMGILNVTPDSFYDGGRYNETEAIINQIDGMIEQGADIIDIGAYSSRPGAKFISETEEFQRLKPVLEIIQKKYAHFIFSIDTFRSGIASVVVQDYGISIINDISAGEMDDKMFDVVANLQVPYVMMHMKGTPENMQRNPVYFDVVKEIIRYFSEKVQVLKKLGVHDVILDPGFGFGKDLDHNYQLLNNLHEFKLVGLPILAGLSRKSMIYRFLNCTPDEALNGTTVLNTMALLQGADILRVHDVKEAVQVLKLVNKCKSLVNLISD